MKRLTIRRNLEFRGLPRFMFLPAIRTRTRETVSGNKIYMFYVFGKGSVIEVYEPTPWPSRSTYTDVTI